MKRRSFIKETTTVVTGLGLSSVSCVKSENKIDKKIFNSCVNMNQEKVSFYSESIKKTIKVVHIVDTHLFMDDNRGVPFNNYSKRMAGAYNQTIHFQNGKTTNPKESFEKTLTIAKKINADLITLVGDIFSFPSELAVEWVLSKLNAIDIPYVYVAGNHDWHYEGMSGKLDVLRDK